MRIAGKNRMLRAAASVIAAGALVAGLAACSADPLAEQYRAGDNKGFIAGDSRVVEIEPADRGEPVDFSGSTEAGETVTSADYEGGVLVVNFWYAACGPCRAEAPLLEEAAASFQGQDVAFLGVNTSDSAEAAAAFAQNYDVTYPSLIAAEDGAIKLAFAERTPINATPTTLVLDKQGRVAARIIGQLLDASILETLVRETLEES
ncbi:TlpA family protein disulfide reductase [Microbacterium sp. 4R-513]|uniref:TlpA family protein disulfide reductase n=1 Tax=Microbacterium sp. 4R-513 TaxID=2567934 RepID=UPI0013E1ADB3|nr:TlpA disulfide reductase family protein [Microbacterium sp. 4R-513]QIG39729.1 TlpA family protein disulfide reductase [Microbacterium sp. 4R-513]